MNSLSRDVPENGQVSPVGTVGDRLRPVFDRIAAGAVARERDRALAYEPVQWLREAGFGALRVPVRHGGAGIGLTQLFRLLVDLAEADPNLPQIVRAHFAFVEGRLHDRDADRAGRWFDLVSGGALFGAAMAEQSDSTGTSTILSRDGQDWRLDGVKYYATGTLYADWIVAVAADGDDRVQLAVPATAAGVTRRDDWDGFGQRLTGSGTTQFDGVRVPDVDILLRTSFGSFPTSGYLTAYYQLFHLATLAGIARAVVRDAGAFVRPRTRTFGVPGKVSQRHDPLVQRVVGRLSALSYSTAALVDAAVRTLDAASPAWTAGVDDHDLYAQAERDAFLAQQIVLEQTLEAATLLFEVGGASATSATLALDRHWRNARVLAAHNPAIQRERALGDLVLNGTPLDSAWRAAAARQAQEPRA
ncbi:acyl-CoA dehydrogenase family protein [Gluconacetobacter tumulisoli]|uniref:Dibenzothiophene monooxygenase n=1 Tax=Gluconacetobacter tumulisoli TaxID=1286189 RepID=A0A7W4K5T4_9PROT|nr:acyl-CoA dehydrogenase family protein [Gluconacetobacter tumulisoli]MBB2200930.1 acyl-CoA dehydrogenase [Gluconacetobacter tumulisoli]